MRPDTAGANWKGRVADNGKGEVWQSPDKVAVFGGEPKNANMIRILDPDKRYPYGCVRFYNRHGQPLRPDGHPGSQAETHIPIRPDGTYDVPIGWSP
jgi:hypothetical protein